MTERCIVFKCMKGITRVCPITRVTEDKIFFYREEWDMEVYTDKEGFLDRGYSLINVSTK